MSRSIHSLPAIGCALLFAASGSLAQTSMPAGSSSANSTSSKSTASAADKNFVEKAAVGGMAEVKLGELATRNGASKSVKDFGQHMVDDHTKANDELAGVAKGKGLTPPAALDAMHQKLVDKFTSLKGESFDRAYWAQMNDDHKKTIALFQAEAKSGKDADLKAFASKTLPTLKMHLQMVQDAMKGGAAKSSS